MKVVLSIAQKTFEHCAKNNEAQNLAGLRLVADKSDQRLARNARASSTGLAR
jgi:hypothetical protein